MQGKTGEQEDKSTRQGPAAPSIPAHHATPVGGVKGLLHSIAVVDVNVNVQDAAAGKYKMVAKY